MKRFKITEDLDTDFSVSGIQDEAGKPLLVTDASKAATLPSKIRVMLEATHTGINRNKVEYTSFGLENSVDSWTRDYHKPVLLNHDSHSDPLGRVMNAEYKQSVIDASKYCIQLTLEITNQAAIERFLDGRYRTFSIGGYTDSAKCSICGKDQMKDGWCGHSRGRKYDNKDCYWTLGQMDYDEISVVNCPADPKAQALSIDFVDVEGKGNDGMTQEPVVTDENEPTGGAHLTDGVGLPQLDDILGLDNGDDGSAKEPVVTDGTEPTTPVEPTVTDGDIADAQKLQDEVDRLIADSILKDEMLLNKDSEINTLKETVTSKESECALLQEQLDAANEDVAGHVKQNVSLARLAHKIMCQRAVDVQIALGAAKEEDRESLMTDYATYTTTKLEDLVTGILNAPKTIDKVKVQHPGASQIEDTTVEEHASGNGEGTAHTLDEYADIVLGFFKSKM